MRMKSLVVASLLAPALALAQPKLTADDWYKEGETQYNLGNFEKAAEAFKSGFAAETDDAKKPAYLYNVAQAYRQGNKCKDAAFFYKRYLVLKDQDRIKPLKPEKRAEIEQRIGELEQCAKNQEAIANKPPNNTLSPGRDGTGPTQPGTTTGTTDTATTSGTTTGTTTGTSTTVGQLDGGGDDDDDDSISASVMVPPKMFTARFVAGASVISAGDIEMGTRATFAFTAGYPVLAKDNLVVDAGIAFSYTPVPYRNNMTGAESMANFVGLLANAGATYFVTPKIGLRGDLGVGMLSFGGIGDMGNPFTENAAGTSGALAMFALRTAVSAEYTITPNLAAAVTPFAFSYSPAKDGLRSDISAITRIDFMLGVGYRM
jgi:hypothetical protein